MQTSKPVNVGNKLSRYAGIKDRTSVQVVSIGQVDGQTLSDCVDAVVKSGDAILFGRTSDGGALSVRVLSNGVTECFYPTDASELLTVLEAITGIATS